MMTPPPRYRWQATTAVQADAVAAAIIDDIGEHHERRVADRPSTLGVLFTSSGSYEHPS